MAVQPEHQKRGIGRELLAESVSQARFSGLSGLQVVLRPANHAARKLLSPYTVRVMAQSPQALDCLLVLNDRIYFHINRY